MIKEYYQGDNIGVAVLPKGIDITQYDIHAEVVKPPYGSICCASTVGSGILISRRVDGVCGFNIPTEITATAPVGIYCLQATYTHIATGVSYTYHLEGLFNLKRKTLCNQQL